MSNDFGINCETDNNTKKADPITQGKIVHDAANIAILQSLVGAGNDGIWGDKTSLKVGEYVRETKDRLGYSDNNADITPEFIEALKQDGISTEAITALSEMKANGILDQSYNRDLSAPAANNESLECTIDSNGGGFDFTTESPQHINPILDIELQTQILETSEPKQLIDADLTNLVADIEYIATKIDLTFDADKANDPLSNMTESDIAMMENIQEKFSALPADVQNNLTEYFEQKGQKHPLQAAPIDTDLKANTPEQTEQHIVDMEIVTASTDGGISELQNTETLSPIQDEPQIIDTPIVTSGNEVDYFDTATNWMEGKVESISTYFNDVMHGDTVQTTPDIAVTQNDAVHETSYTNTSGYGMG